MNYEKAFYQALARLKSEYPNEPHFELVQWAHEIASERLAQFSTAAA